MATKLKTEGRNLDAESRAILFQGANLSELGVLFRADHRTLKQRMYGIEPVGTRHGASIYEIAAVAEKMGKLSEEQVRKAMMTMNHDQLPKQLSKEYWAGQRSRQEFELRAGDLWPTTKVIEQVGEMVKSLKMELDLLTDGVERATELTDRQRDVIKQLVKGAKVNMLKRLEEKFQVKPPTEKISEPIVVIDDDDEL
jgi:hypothetical protein